MNQSELKEAVEILKNADCNFDRPTAISTLLDLAQQYLDIKEPEEKDIPEHTCQ